MSDIIKDAKQLLDGATPGPWVISGEFDPECPELQGAPQLENGLLKVPIISHDIYGDFFHEDADLVAAAPELAQALAEETWEYIAEWCDNGVWAPIEIEMFDGVFPNLTAARGYIKVAKTRGTYENTRIVRRRVSPPEVISE